MEHLGVIATFILGLITAGVLLFVHRKNREVAQEAVKVSCLALMTELADQRAYLKDRLIFVVEETFKRYYGKYIPIEVIRKICVHENASYAFLAYKEVSGLMMYDKDSRKFNTLSRTARAVRLLALTELSILTLSFSGIIIALVFVSINRAEVPLNVVEHFIFLVLGGFSAICFWAFFFILNRGINEYQNLKKIKYELQDDVEETLTRSNDIWIAGVLSIVIIAIASFMICY